MKKKALAQMMEQSSANDCTSQTVHLSLDAYIYSTPQTL